PLVTNRKTRPARHRPALEHAVELEAQIVMGAPRRMLLHDKLQARRLGLPFALALRLGLRRAREIALAGVVLERVLARPRRLRPVRGVHDGPWALAQAKARAASRNI